MIIVDMGSVQMLTLHGREVDSTSVMKPLFKHALLYKLLHIKKKFKKYGKMILAYDNAKKGYWRRHEFPYYKAKRKEDRAKSDVDWKNYFEACEELEQEVNENIPGWIPINIDTCEADDIIGVLAKYNHLKEDIMIVSSDGDLLQLQRYKNVKQWCPMKAALKIEKKPDELLRTKLIKGDSKDGVPNILSPDDVLVTEGIRQKPVTAKKLNEWLYKEPTEFCTGEMMVRYKMNQILLDFDYIPNNLIEEIKTKYENKSSMKKPTKVWKYLTKNKYRNLVDEASNF